MKKFYFLFLLFTTPLFSAAFTIINDSEFLLTATIYSKDNLNLGSLTIGRGNQVKWQDSDQGGVDYTIYPYKVVFTCPKGTNYGTFRNATPGMYVYARAASGRRSCDIERKPYVPHSTY